MANMRFDALYLGNRLKVINPTGDVAICTLWSKVESAEEVLKKAGIDLSPESSRISVISNLYGNGLPEMLRNLLWNPQIRYIVIVGKNLSGSKEHLINFFEQGIEEATFLGSPAFRIIGTNRIIDGELNQDMFLSAPKFIVFGDVGSPETLSGFKGFFENLAPFKPCTLPRVPPPDIPKPEVTRFPSNARDHNIVRDGVIEAWIELVFRLYRFGHRNNVGKSSGSESRTELQNVKVVIENPVEESEELLSKYGFSLDKFRGYQDRILDSIESNDLNYTYGNRLRGYFEHEGVAVDSLEICGNRLKEKPESRHAFIALWDNSEDLPRGKETPCFVTAFFRKFEDKLTLTATFRAHNAMTAWPENVYGLMAIQRFVSKLSGIEPGAITVISHSISISPDSLETAKKIAEDKESNEVVDLLTGKEDLRMDPNGEFTTTVDLEAMEIVAQHSLGGMTLGEYRGKTAYEVERKIDRDNAISLVGHALYIGRQLALREEELKAYKKKK